MLGYSEIVFGESHGIEPVLVWGQFGVNPTVSSLCDRSRVTYVNSEVPPIVRDGAVPEEGSLGLALVALDKSTDEVQFALNGCWELT